jgi:hypothetical protein
VTGKKELSGGHTDSLYLRVLVGFEEPEQGETHLISLQSHVVGKSCRLILWKLKRSRPILGMTPTIA